MGFRGILDIGLPLHHGTLNSDLVLETEVSICTPKIQFPDQQNHPRHFLEKKIMHFFLFVASS
jgi:hypothetical protein